MTARPVIPLLCSLLVVVTACAALLGWAAEIPALASLGGERIPMAPSTAVGFLASGIAVLLRPRAGGRGASWWAGLVVHAAVGIVTLGLGITSTQGITYEIEHPGFVLQHDPGVAPVGHMSPLTALCFVLLSLAGLASLASGQAAWRGVAARWLAGSVAAVGFVLLLAYTYGTPLLYGGALIPPAATTSGAFVALGIALIGLAEPGAWLPIAQVEPTKAVAAVFLLVFLVPAAGIVTAGLLYSRRSEQRFREEVGRRLVAVTDLKVRDLEQWRRERRGDAAVIEHNPAFARLVERFFDRPSDADARAALLQWLSQVRTAYGYERVFLVDPHGTQRLCVPNMPPRDMPQLQATLPEVLEARRPVLVDLHRNGPGRPVHLLVLAPISRAGGRREVLGAVALRVNPQAYLYPLINRWPVLSGTAETLLVRREGHEVVLLNDLRLRSNTALTLRMPVARTELPAAMAVLGREGIVSGRDDRGVPVLACLRPVPGSPWFLVARVGESEIESPLGHRRWLLVGFVISVLLATGAAAGLLWRHQALVFYKERYAVAEALRESEQARGDLARQRQLALDAAHLGWWRYDPVTKLATWDGRSTEIFGVSGDQSPNDEILARLHPDDLPGVWAAVEAALDPADPKPYAAEYRIRLPDGSQRWVEAHGLATLEGEGAHRRVTSLIGTVQDVTDRKTAEEELRRLNAELEQRVEARTAQLQAASRELEAFSYSVSHDLRAPLRGVDGWSLALLEDYGERLDGEAREYLGRIRSETQRMGVLIDDLLELSRVARAEMAKEHVDLGVLAHDVLRRLRSAHPDRQVETVIAPNLTAYGDHRLLEIVLTNLLDNAWKFTATREVARIEIGRATNGDSHAFFVHDNGVGFDPAYARNLFGAFQRMHAPSEFPGTGIGLATVRRIIHRHGGRVWAEARQDAGATFYFSVEETA